ncbi:MAG: mannonate dehydratase [Monoglobales bacterium]
MILSDYFRSENDICWDYAKQCGVKTATVRLPETESFDVTDFSHWETVYKRFEDFGIKPVVIEPMPNSLHDHIKTGDKMRDVSIEKIIKMLPIMDRLDIRTICFNFMAHIGWLRTSENFPERGGALVTAFDMKDIVPTDKAITKEQLWDNYTYFIKAIIPYAEKYNINLALHPDDPPIEKLGNVERIMTSYENIKKALGVVNSKNLGVTMCQATYKMMGEDLHRIIPELSEKIFFIHFRNVMGTKENFRETFHDNGSIDMADILRLYKKCGVNVPIRVDHVPLMAGEKQGTAGYTALGRLYAIGYLKGLLDAIG